MSAAARPPAVLTRHPSVTRSATGGSPVERARLHAQIDDHIPSWRKNRKTKAGKPRQKLPREELLENAAKMSPTTLFDLLWRLRVRSNYKEGDALLTGAHDPADAATFHAALSEIVSATLLTVEIYLAHIVGRATLERCAAGLPVPMILEPYSVRARVPLW